MNEMGKLVGSKRAADDDSDEHRKKRAASIKSSSSDSGSGAEDVNQHYSPATLVFRDIRKAWQGRKVPSILSKHTASAADTITKAAMKWNQKHGRGTNYRQAIRFDDAPAFVREVRKSNPEFWPEKYKSAPHLSKFALAWQWTNDKGVKRYAKHRPRFDLWTSDSDGSNDSDESEAEDEHSESDQV
jgi:hypothetical protein